VGNLPDRGREGADQLVGSAYMPLPQSLRCSDSVDGRQQDHPDKAALLDKKGRRASGKPT